MIAIHMNTFAPEVSAIAGVGPGLGASLARKLAKEGSRLALLARSPDFLETLSNELRQHGTEALTIPTDVSDADQVAAAFELIRDRLGPVDLLINNASGSGPFGQAFVDISPESFARGWQVGALGPFLCSNKLCLQCLLKMPAASCSPARLRRFVEAPSLSAAQNLRCADWRRLWRGNCGPKVSILRISLSMV